MNWSAARDRERVRQHGTESVARQGASNRARRREAAVSKRPTLPEPIVIDRWWKNRGGDAVYVRLSTFEGFNLVDVRTWRADAEGVSRPGKGFACSVKHLPRLVKAFTKALVEARAAGLVDKDSE